MYVTQSKEITTNLNNLFPIEIEKRAAQVELKPMTLYTAFQADTLPLSYHGSPTAVSNQTNTRRRATNITEPTNRPTQNSVCMIVCVCVHVHI